MKKKRSPRSESFYKWHTERIKKDVGKLEESIKDMEFDYCNAMISDDDWRAYKSVTDLMDKIIKARKALARKRKSLMDRILEVS